MLSSYVPLLVASAFVVHGTRKRSLSPSGALAAFVVGYMMMAVSLKEFGISVIVFYLLGSRATKYGKNVKQKLEEGHDSAGGGYRNYSQVLCNVAVAYPCSLVWDSLVNPRSFYAIWNRNIPHTVFEAHQWCAISNLSEHRWSRGLVLASLAQLACCLGDTLASELGILSKSPPRLITNFKVVPPGTNGGVTLLGSAVSIAGGALMGFVTLVDLLVENPACRMNITSNAIQLLAHGALAGGLGSLIDSFLGATLQRTQYSNTSRRILVVNRSGEEDVKTVSGLNVLTNNQVNLVSSVITSALIVIIDNW